MYRAFRLTFLGWHFSVKKEKHKLYSERSGYFKGITILGLYFRFYKLENPITK